VFITVEQLQEHPVRFDETFAPGQIDYAIEDLLPVAALKVQGTASLLDQEIHVKGRLETELESTCARCLEPVRQVVKRSFDLYYHPLAEVPQEDEVEVPRGEEELGFYQGDGLLLDDVAKEQVLLALPLRILCREDCKGLCPHCGGNRNQVPCNCRTHTHDPRWDVLKEI
jgi:uncharacterized protein